jgi:hypothetical protein
MTVDLPKLKNLEQFLFEIPLYANYALSDEFSAAHLYGLNNLARPIDGHCPRCQRASTFVVDYKYLPEGSSRHNVANRHSFDEMSIKCVRDDSHKVRYYFLIKKLVVQKIGQYPSLADISNDEVSTYRRNMDKGDAAEFHKAIGLAAHGVGVGSFVYLRRVFERLVYKRFEEFKSSEGWEDKQFYAVRMEDKISLLNAHLPDFLVENRKIYSILSVGVHELDEQACLSWFDVMKHSIIIILEDDKKKKEELERRTVFSRAIATFAPETDR